MTLRVMLSLLDNMIGDFDNEIFSPEFKLSLLNMGQGRAVSMLERHLLEELGDVSENVSITDGAFSLTALKSYRDKALDGVRVSGGKFCRKLSFHEYRQLVDGQITLTTNSPAYYVRGKSVYVLPSDISAVDVYFMGNPADMMLGDTEATDTQCELDPQAHMLAVYMAAHIACGSVPPQSQYANVLANRSEYYMTLARDLAYDLNNQFAPTESNDFRDNPLDAAYEIPGEFPVNVEQYTP